jgi:hypothetical protein
MGSTLMMLGMRAEGHRDSKIEAHPRVQILMNLRFKMKDATHTFARFCRTKSPMMEPMYRQEAGPEVVLTPVSPGDEGAEWEVISVP